MSSVRLTEARRCALVRVCGASARVDFVESPGGSAELSLYDSIVVDGSVADGSVADVHELLLPWIHAGGSLLVIGAESSGSIEAHDRRGEWIVKITASGHPAASRLPPEIALHDHFQPVPTTGQEDVLAWVNVGFRDEAAVVTRRVGMGGITTCGLGFDNAALAHPDLALMLRRCLAHANVNTCHGRPRTVGLGIVGYGPYGGMGQRHGLAAAATEGLELVAACDPDPSRRKAAEGDFSGLTAYANLDDLVADEAVEAVIVATPPNSHAALARSLLEEGKHVIVEKPMCMTAAEADQLIVFAHRNHLSLTVNQNRRWDPDYRAILAALERGWLGELFSMETFVGSFEHPCRAWHSEESISGGAIYDWGSHHLDWAIQLMGSPPVSVTAHSHKRVWRDVTNADQVRVHLAWADGREAIFVQSDVAGVRKPKFYLQGTSGTLVGHYRQLTTERVEAGLGYMSETAHHAEAPVELTVARYEPGLGLTQTSLAPLAGLSYPFHHNLADHFLLGEPLAVTAESVRPVIAVLEAATRSAASHGAPVRLDRD